MKVTFFCPICQNLSSKEGGVTAEKGGRGAWKIEPVHLPISNNYSYTFKCKRGHEITTLLNNTKYEIIFESGISALVESYIREAVSSFYAALECFFDEMLIYFYKLLDVNIFNDDFKKTLNLTNRSERKIGAYYALYQIVMGEPALKFSEEKISTVRNKVIHGVIYPTEEEAVKFADEIKNYIVTTIIRIESKLDYLISNDLIYTLNKFSGGEINAYTNSQSYEYILSTNKRLNVDILKTSVKQHNPFWHIMQKE